MRIVFAVEAGAQIGLGIDGVAPDGNDTTAGYRRMSCAGPACQPRGIGPRRAAVSGKAGSGPTPASTNRVWQ